MKLSKLTLLLFYTFSCVNCKPESQDLKNPLTHSGISESSHEDSHGGHETKGKPFKTPNRLADYLKLSLGSIFFIIRFKELPQLKLKM